MNKEYAPVITRIALALVFLWFGFTQVFTDMLIGYVPTWVPFAASTVGVISGVFELIFGGLLLIGLFTRTSAALLGLYLIGIIFSLGYNDVAVRDVGLLLVLIAVIVNGPDKWCMDVRKKK